MTKKQNMIGEKTNKGIQYLDKVSPEMLANPNYIPDHLQSVIAPVIRKGREEFDVLTELIESSDKSSTEYMDASRQREKIATKWINIKNQVENFKKYTGELKDNMQNMSRGTKDESLYTNMLVGGAQADGVVIDETGRLMFGAKYGNGENDASWFALDDMMGAGNGSPIVTEPYGSKTFVWKMAQETKQNSDAGKEFDEQWASTRIHNDLTEGGSQNTIGMAFTDLAGDNKSKSFAEMYESGLNDPLYYTHPETGEAMPSDSEWMKDPNNSDILKTLLTKYVTSVMKDVHGPVASEQVGASKTQLAMDLIKKYKK